MQNLSSGYVKKMLYEVVKINPIFTNSDIKVMQIWIINK